MRAVWRSVGDALLDDVIDHKLTSQNRCYINTIPGPEPTFDISHRMGCGWVLGPRYGKGVVMIQGIRGCVEQPDVIEQFTGARVNARTVYVYSARKIIKLVK